MCLYVCICFGLRDFLFVYIYFNLRDGLGVNGFVLESVSVCFSVRDCVCLHGLQLARVLPADMAIVVPATMPIATPLERWAWTCAG